jgi:hypothetical protein
MTRYDPRYDQDKESFNHKERKEEWHERTEGRKVCHERIENGNFFHLLTPVLMGDTCHSNDK